MRLVFYYFSAGTYIHLFIAFIINPGFLPAWMKVPKTREGHAPLRVVRIYNARLWLRTNLYTFDEYIGSDDLEDGSDSFAISLG